MELEKITARIRPRKSWEAIDLGVALVQQHFFSMYKIWLLTTLPFFLVLSAVFNQYSLSIIFGFWLLKPLWERPLLHFLSRELFGERLSVTACVKDFFALAKIQWISSLTWRRLSFTRSLDLPIIQLEGLAGNSRSQRLRVIHSIGSGAAVWLTILFFISEILFYLSFLVLIYFLLPAPVSEALDFYQWFINDVGSPFAGFIRNCLIYVVITFVAPFYVACGFAIYLNQRTHLEAWDIELSFKRLAKRLKEQSEHLSVRLASWFIVLSLSAIITGFPANNLQAAEGKEDISNQPVHIDPKLFDIEKLTVGDLLETINEEKNMPEKESPHKTNKALINEIMQGEDFHQVMTDYKYVEVEPDNEQPLDDSEQNSWLSSFSLLSGIGYFISKVAEFALWVFVAVLLLYLAMRYRHLITTFRPNKKHKLQRPKILFGLDLQSETLPEKPWLVAHQMVEQKLYRQALSLLYRSALIWYMDNKPVIIKEGDTELEFLAKISPFSDKNDKQFMRQLTHQWRYLAYAHQLPNKDTLIELCESWPRVLKIRVTSEAGQIG